MDILIPALSDYGRRRAELDPGGGDLLVQIRRNYEWEINLAIVVDGEVRPL